MAETPRYKPKILPHKKKIGKIKEMTAFTYIKEKARMTEGCSRCCDCPLSITKNGYGIPCRKFESQYITDAIAVVELWASTHPDNSTDTVKLSEAEEQIRKYIQN